MQGEWAYGGMPMCLVGPAAARRPGGTAVSWWCTRWHCSVSVAHQVAWWHCSVSVAYQVAWWHGGGTVAHLVTRWHGLLVTARRNGGMVARKIAGNQVNGAKDTRSIYICFSYAHIFLRIIFQII